MRLFYALALIIITGVAHAQVVASFEEFNLATGDHLNNAAPEPGFMSGSIFLPNDFNSKWNVWSGYAISADTNTTMPGFLNQYSAIPGEGALGTRHYVVGYVYDPEFIYPVGKAMGKRMIGFYVTNSTYSYLSMRDGDGFAKKFGGETGADPDFFMLTIKKYYGGAISDDSINVYLADFRSPNDSKDYILSDWKYVDLTSLGEVDSLVMKLTSSDVGAFGMNTPAYICFDEISTDTLLASADNDLNNLQLVVGPNPAKDVIHFDAPRKGKYEIVNLQGRICVANQFDAGPQSMALPVLPAGMYVLTLDGRAAGKFVIRE